MSLLKQDITKRRRVDKTTFQMELDKGNSKKYVVEVICNSTVYKKKSEGYLPSFYYLVFWKGYLEEENTWELILAIQHFWRLVTIFHYDHPDKPTATSPPINSTQLMAKLIVKSRAGVPSFQQKQSRPAKDSGTSKLTKKDLSF